MLTVTTLDRTSAKALYIQLYEAIKDKIMDRELAPNEMLPSKRALSQQLGLSLKTIENAYSQLDLEGYIYSVEKKGYFVKQIDTYMMPTVQKQKYVCKPVEHLYDHDLSVTDASREEFPFATWSRLMREVLSEEQEGILHAVNFWGHPRLRSAIAGYLEQNRGMSVSPDQIVIGSGTEFLYARLIHLLGDNRVFALEDPGTSKTKNLYKYYHVPYRPIPIDEEGIRVDLLEKSDCDIVNVMPSHHYPMGYVTSVSRRVELMFWANAVPGRYIIENEYDCEFRYVGMPVPTIHSIDIHDKVIYMSSFNRYCGNAVRISYMVLPKELMEIYVENNLFGTSPVSVFEQLLLAKFIEEGYLERQINHLKRYYSIRRDQIIRTFKNHPISEKAELIEHTAGTHFILKLRTFLKDSELKHIFAEKRINIRFISEYCDLPDYRYSHMLLINYTGISEELFEKFLDTLAASL